MNSNEYKNDLVIMSYLKLSGFGDENNVNFYVSGFVQKGMFDFLKNVYVCVE